MDYVYFIIIQPIPTYFESDMRLESWYLQYKTIITEISG